jgi:hypothetical protein
LYPVSVPANGRPSSRSTARSRRPARDNLDQHSSPVIGIGLATDVSGAFEPVDQSGDSAGRHPHQVGLPSDAGRTNLAQSLRWYVAGELHEQQQRYADLLAWRLAVDPQRERGAAG